MKPKTSDGFPITLHRVTVDHWFGYLHPVLLATAGEQMAVGQAHHWFGYGSLAESD